MEQAQRSNAQTKVQAFVQGALLILKKRYIHTIPELPYPQIISESVNTYKIRKLTDKLVDMVTLHNTQKHPHSN